MHAPERALARVDVGAVSRNCERLRALVGDGTELCAVVKADAYGHGDVWCAKAAKEGGAGWLAVAAASEATELRRHGIAGPILVMGALTGEEIRAAIDAVYPLEPEPRDAHATARVHRFADGRGRIGFINPVSEPFCGDRDRIRLTAEGKLRTCLFALHETDLRAPLRAGETDAELETVVRDAVWRKEVKHRVNEPGFRQPPATMTPIGG